ncbi:hypothetical protein [Caminibacter pacificus]|uniref:MetA-pathway of phenol degradation n=1 Tax=Caminibacter pacificus TaxID=1424653 RepID=A0AAJ4UXL7_9BACT|nr:hypothetical protein [Caminibacter pacificus]QCI28969.1 hypothetical protein C6V80_08290 [Caminibacter pacificus]ROR39559.1 hypothetical protein EDC58_1501 [Caminibacter pacificus]
MKKIFFLLFPFPFLLFGKMFTIEDNNKINISTGFNYINSCSSNSNTNLIVLKTLNGDFVKVPVNSVNNQLKEYIDTYMSFKYSVNEKLSFIATIDYYFSFLKSLNEPYKTIYQKGFNYLSIGTLYNIKQETETPAYYLKITTNAIENIQFDNNRKNKNFTNFNFTIGNYWTIDPLVFNFEFSYILYRKLNYRQNSIKYGNIYDVSPNVIFNINPLISIGFGVDVQYSKKDKINGNYSDNDVVLLLPNFSLVYQIGIHSSLNVKYSWQNNLTPQNTISIEYSLDIK